MGACKAQPDKMKAVRIDKSINLFFIEIEDFELLQSTILHEIIEMPDPDS
jgi:hypothetical protein